MKKNSVTVCSHVSSAALAVAALMVSATLAAASTCQSGSGPAVLASGLGSLSNAAPGGSASDPVTLSAEFKTKPGTRQGILSVTAKIEPDWHLYSITQPAGGPIKSKISVIESEAFKLASPFQPTTKPTIKTDVPGFDIPVEEHEGSVVWVAKIEMAENTKAEELSPRIIFNGQCCESKPNGSCRLLSGLEVAAKFAGEDATLDFSRFTDASSNKVVEFCPQGSHVKITAVLEPNTGENLTPGSKAALKVTIKPLDEFHFYERTLEERDYMPTMLGLSQTGGLQVAAAKASAKPVKGEAFGAEAFYYEEPVTWTFPITIPQDSAAGQSLSIKGFVGVQACDHTSCDRPLGAAFEIPLTIGGVAGAAKFSDASYAAAQKAAIANAKTGEQPASSDKN